MTVEAAFAVASIVAVVLCCVGALLAASTQIRCVDAAREAARLGARGDVANAVSAAGRIAPSGARIAMHGEGDRIVATVYSRTPLLPLLELHADAVATREPGVR